MSAALGGVLPAGGIALAVACARARARSALVWVGSTAEAVVRSARLDSEGSPGSGVEPWHDPQDPRKACTSAGRSPGAQKPPLPPAEPPTVVEGGGEKSPS